MRHQDAAPAGWQAFGPIIEQAVDAVVITDGNHDVVLFNAAAEALWGLDRRDVLGRNMRLLIPEGARTEHDAHIANPHRGPRKHVAGTTMEVPVARPDGTMRWGSLSLSRTEAGSEVYHAAFVKDVTEEVRRREELYLLSLVADKTDRVVIITDRQERIVYVNRAFADLFGYSGAEVLGKAPSLILAGSHTDAQALSRLSRADRSVNLELIACDKAGREVWVTATVNPVLDEDGGMRHAVSVLSNITETRQMQVMQQHVLEAVARDDDLNQIAALICREVEAIAPGVVCSIQRVDAEGRLRPLASPSLPPHFSAAIDGLPIGPSVGSCGTAAHRGEAVVVEDIETDPLWAPYKQLPLPLGLKACWSSPIALKNGRVAGTFAFYFSTKCGPSIWHERLVEACLHLCALAIERHEAKAHIAHLAYYDTLTGLPNRRKLCEDIDARIAGCGEGGQDGMALLFLDIDSFKDINDSLGHSAGDMLLTEMARRLESQLRPGDMVSRLGGDEFVIVLEGCDAGRASAVAERILREISAPIQIEGISLDTSASIGISLFPADSADREELLKHADTAMYEAKSAGRGMYRFYSPDMNRQVQERLRMAAALKESLARGHLELHYQPQIAAEDGSLHGVEALARWNHPDFGLVPPDTFVPLAEEYGLIEAIGEWAVGEALRQMAGWRTRGLSIPAVSVNLSALNFRNPHLPALISAALKENGLAPEVLTIEITESVMMDACPATRQTVEAVALLGVKLSVDDFGTGYSSLSSISTLPIEEIKLDRSFMRDLNHDRNARTVASAVIRIGQSLGLTVVAEGVETEPQRRFLQSLCCDVMQGYLFSQPLTPAAFEQWLARHGRRGAQTAQVA